MSDWYENALKRLSSAPANPSIRHSREGGNPRTNIPRKNANRDTTTYVHTATPLRISGESTPRTPIRRRNPEGCGRCQFSYLGVPPPAGMSDWYENDVTRFRKCFGVPEILRIVIPAPISSFRRRPESRGAGRGECSAGACPPLGRRRGMAESSVRTRRTKTATPGFQYLGVAGDNRDGRLVRKCP